MKLMFTVIDSLEKWRSINVVNIHISWIFLMKASEQRVSSSINFKKRKIMPTTDTVSTYFISTFILEPNNVE